MDMAEAADIEGTLYCSQIVCTSLYVGSLSNRATTRVAPTCRHPPSFQIPVTCVKLAQVTKTSSSWKVFTNGLSKIVGREKALPGDGREQNVGAIVVEGETVI